MSPLDPVAVRVSAEFKQMLDERGRGAASALARKLGMTPQNVSRWSTGDQPIPVARWVEIPVAMDDDPLRLVRASGVADGEGDFLERWSQMDAATVLNEWQRSFGESPEKRREAERTAQEQRAELSRRVEQMEAQVAALTELLASVVGAIAENRVSPDELQAALAPLLQRRGGASK